ncbi:MAG: ATP-binding protein [Thermoflexales bacterium]|nr:ATP-binding protein [Thermoflexales bacterium]
METSPSQEWNSTDLALQLGGVAPNVIREFSGIYPTFVSAFKELISNAYDADATMVTIQLAPDLGTITVQDNGTGMTPLELQTEYFRIGGSQQRQAQELTTAGRQPIGRKGIGFLAIARYCHQVEIVSHADRKQVFQQAVVLEPRARTRRVSFCREALARALVPFITVQSVSCGSILLAPNIYKQNGDSIEFTTKAWEGIRGKSLTVQYVIDCCQVDTHAAIDYDYLLNLKDDCNLEQLQDFCRLDLLPHTDQATPHFTRVTLHLQEFVQRELQTPRRRGRVRNMASASGLDHFLWLLGRSTPVSYALSPQELERDGLQALAVPISPTPFVVKVVDTKSETRALCRPLLEAVQADSPGQSILARQAVQIKMDGLSAQGYLWGFAQPIFPAEMRGITVRVRGVEIGQPDFLGAENDLPARYRSLLNQVLGEFIVTQGLDAINAIMPGREGFYAENAQFQALRRHLVGDGASNLGILGQVLEGIWEQGSVESSTARIVQEARQRRKAFLEVSEALTGMSLGARYGRALRRLFSRSDVAADGLSRVPEHQVQLPGVVASYSLELANLAGQDYELDTKNKVARLNRDADMWNESLYVLGRDFKLSLRNGGPNDPLCELDLISDTIYVNWMHPTRAKMGDAMFIKSALFWRIAYLAAEDDVDLMMDMAHRLLSFTG